MARWRLSGDGATALRWFYAELQRPAGMEAHYFNRLLKTEGRSPRSLATLVIAHPMFDQLNWKSLEVLARARAEYPRETAESLIRLARWRQQIRSSASGW